MKIRLKAVEELLPTSLPESLKQPVLQVLGGRVWDVEPSLFVDGAYYLPGPICTEAGEVIRPVGVLILPSWVAEALE